MNIAIVKEKHPSHLTGGEYSRLDLTIVIDPDLDIDEQRMCVCHSVIENFCPMCSHDKYDELAELILEGLSLLT